MDVARVFHMNEGTGETSYASNSLLQRKIISLAKPVIAEAIACLYRRTLPRSLAIADLGCSSGPNTFFVISELIKAVENICRELNQESPEYHIFLNDLPGNDFNSIFKSLGSFKEKLCNETLTGIGPCFFAGVPGSFYGRIFPTNSLHFVHSSSSLHWLSQVPESIENNRGNICVTRTSPSNVQKAYYHQFQRDFSMFLKCRAEELIEGGGMVLTFLGRRSNDPSSHEPLHIWGLLAQALNDLVLEGIIKEDQMDSFNIPLYAPSPSEVKSEVEKEGSFSINRLEISEVSWKAACGEAHSDDSAYKVAQCVRAAAELLLVGHFGEAIIEPVFKRYQDIVADRMSKEKTVIVNFTISMTRTI